MRPKFLRPSRYSQKIEKSHDTEKSRDEMSHSGIDAMHINIDAKGWFMIGANKREYTFRNNVWQDYFHEFIGIIVPEQIVSVDVQLF